MLIVKLVYKLSNVPDDHVIPYVKAMLLVCESYAPRMFVIMTVVSA